LGRSAPRAILAEHRDLTARDTMSRFGVTEVKETELERKFAELGIRDADIEESFTRSSGPGGQNVNKTSTCVVLKHLPTGIIVKMQQERSQSINRFLARRTLADRIEALVKGRNSAKQKEIEKIRRQKRKRSKRAKEKMLDAKKHQSRKKELRGRVEY
jgi:peptide chain release factor